MKKIICLIVMLCSFSAFAQEKIRMRPQNLKDIKASANELRSQEKEIRKMFMQLILRKAQMDIVTIMTKNHMADEEIQKVMDGNEMKTFLSNLEKNPKMIAKVEAHVQKLLRPGAIEAHVLKQREQITKATEENLLLARNELRKSNTFRTKEKVFAVDESEPLVTKVWNHLVDDLYKD